MRQLILYGVFVMAYAQYLKEHPEFVMANVLGAFSSLLSGTGDVSEYDKRIKDTLSQDPNRWFLNSI